MPGDQDIEYTDERITKLQTTFGKGFLSPGGMEEVAKIVEGIDIRGKEVLDIGVGIGGPACLLVTKHGAGRVTGIDVEEPVLKEAQATVSFQNLQNQIDLQFVTPGPLPFDDATFDIVFSKDSIIHIADKQSLFSEVYRVLKPGGVIVIGEGTCMVRTLMVLLRFYHHESCGQCTPCREGTGWLYRVLCRIENGDARQEERCAHLG